MKLFYDNIIYNLQNAGGISTYWSELSKRFVDSNFAICFFENENTNIARKQFHIPDNLIVKHKSYLPLTLNRFLRLDVPETPNKSVFHSSYFRIGKGTNIRNVVTIHDFVHEKYYSGIRRWLHSYQKFKAIKLADAIIVISENTKKDLLFYFPDIDRSKIEVIYNGVSDYYCPLEKVEPSSKKYLLFVGSRENYKNFDFVVDSLKSLEEYDLAIVGSPLTNTEIDKLNDKLSNRWTNYINISNDELNVLYNKAFALVYPSSYEGFGIPIAEAMRAGCPFIACNNSSIPEVAGDAGVLMNQLDESSFISALDFIKHNRVELIKKGLKQGQLFSWDSCFQKTKNLYEKLIS